MRTITYTYDGEHPTNRDYLVAVLADAIDDGGASYEKVKEIGYAECANAMLKMWIDNVLTDGEYNRIMDKLNAHHNAGRRRAESEE